MLEYMDQPIFQPEAHLVPGFEFFSLVLQLEYMKYKYVKMEEFLENVYID